MGRAAQRKAKVRNSRKEAEKVSRSGLELATFLSSHRQNVQERLRKYNFALASTAVSIRVCDGGCLPKLSYCRIADSFENRCPFCSSADMWSCLCPESDGELEDGEADFNKQVRDIVDKPEKWKWVLELEKNPFHYLCNADGTLKSQEERDEFRSQNQQYFSDVSGSEEDSDWSSDSEELDEGDSDLDQTPLKVRDDWMVSGDISPDIAKGHMDSKPHFERRTLNMSTPAKAVECNKGHQLVVGVK
jgi:hypothetical protein